ncbi:MAG TPA: zinc metalloprotease HtpX [Nitrososphaera sp.]|jgi:heat shock protein HtpX|nr:zinc metalloprotease HtpX [Nitrososphaera sp.]
MFTKKQPWQKRDTGLTARMIVSFAVLTVLYIIFLSVLAYVGVSAIAIAVIAGIMILAQWYFSDKIVLWSTGAKIVSREQFPELHDLVERIVARNNLSKPRIAVINTRTPNSFATGKTPKSSIVAVTTGLMDELDAEELEGVIAHELAHIKNRDVLVLTLASIFSVMAWYLMRFGMYGAMFGGGGGGGYGRRGNEGGAAMLLILLIAIITWIASFLIIRAISRYREYVADRDGALITGKPSKLASALLKISGTMKRIPTRDLREIEGMNAFFIIPAVSGSSFTNLFSTHPPVAQRVKKLMEMEAAMS